MVINEGIRISRRKESPKDFEQGMKALFQVPKDAAKGKKKARKKRAKNDQSRTSESGPSRDSGEA
jgi:hypothetical protein